MDCVTLNLILYFPGYNTHKILQVYFLVKVKILKELQTFDLRLDKEEIAQFEFWRHNVNTHYTPENLS